ncbi:MAG TPA: YggS family pyridoxal phosphate-dependent enzyme [Acidimicrobiales bacterium]
MSIDPAVVARRADEVRHRIAAAGGDPARVTLVAVTKGFGPDAAAAALAAGLVDLGENYAQELVHKAEVLAGAEPRPRWHAIGRLQRNKVKALAPWVALWQSIDRLDLGLEVARRAPGAAVLIQVNVSDEPQKGGAAPEAVDGLQARLTDAGLDVRGLMAVGATGPPEAARAGFRVVRQIADRLELGERSMGMTGDLEGAVAEGATMVRVGTALFGARALRPGVRDYGSRVQED